METEAREQEMELESLEESRNKLVQQIAEAEAKTIEQQETIASHVEDIHRYSSQMEVLQSKIEEFEMASDRYKSDYEKTTEEVASLKYEREDLLAQLSKSQQTIKGLSSQADEVSRQILQKFGQFVMEANSLTIVCAYAMVLFFSGATKSND